MGLSLVDSSHKVMKVKFLRIVQSSRFGDFLQRLQGVVMKVLHPLALIFHNQGNLTLGILCGDASGTVASVASLCLNATQGKHEASCAIAPIGAERQGSGDVKGGDDFAAGAHTDLVSEVQSDQGVVHQAQAFLHWGAHVV